MNTERSSSATNPTEQQLRDLAEQLGSCLTTQSMKLASAESCTGGWLAKIITDIPGSSAWFTGSVVCYSNNSKHSLLGVAEDTLDAFGAVSSETVIEMSYCLFSNMDADVAVSISGIAGPGGGSEDKPVGLVWLSWAIRDKRVCAKPYNFEGDREAVRRQSIEQALYNLLDLLHCDHDVNDLRS